PVAAEASQQKETDETQEVKLDDQKIAEEDTEDGGRSRLASFGLPSDFLDNLKKKINLALEGTGEESDISASVKKLVEGDLKALFQGNKTEEGEDETLHSAVQALVSDSIGDVKKLIEGALKIKAEQRASGEPLSVTPDKALLAETGKKEILAQAAGGASQTEGEADLAFGQASKESSTLALASAQGTEGKQETKASGFEDVLLPRKPQGEASSQSQVVVGGLASAVQTQSSTTATTTSSTANAGAQAASVGEVGSTNLLGEGGRSSGSYDFAAQLSAARVARGGAIGLQNPAEQIAVQINKMAKDGKEEMTINLRPPELGKVQVKLAFSSDGRVQVMVTADNQNALDLLMKDQSSLHKALQEAGLQTDSSSLEFSLNEGNQNETLAQNRAQRNSENTEFSRITLEEADLLDEEIETYYLTPGRVNLRV
ncbi:MAG TPA: hypothetical protein DD400_03270, partial [Rhodospirillaceae bacterium]|nr:hypothetical protein [Rhodospirillaceae bacterium]